MTHPSSQIVLESARLRVRLDPARGGEITAFEPDGGPNAIAHYDWTSPAPAHDGRSLGSSELDWLVGYRGGWQTLFPNAAAACEVDGVPIAFHGDASIARAEVVERTSERCVLRIPSRLPLVLTRTIRLAEDAATLYVEEEAYNEGASAVDFLWGHHPTFPAIPGAVIDVPGETVHVEPATPGDLIARSGSWPHGRRTDGEAVDLSIVPAQSMVRLLYLESVRAGWAALRPPASSDQPAIALAWDLETFPHLWLWLQNGENAFPWWGRARMVGLEPQRAWPFDGLANARERGQALRLEPGGRRSTWVTLTTVGDASRRVDGVSRSGDVSFSS